MNYLERRVAELKSYRPDRTAPKDLDEFWERTLTEAAQRPLKDRKEKVNGISPYITHYRVRYEGFDETPIHGWYLVPSFAGAGPFPCVVIYHGYTGSKGYPEDYAHWLLAGYAVFAVDVRGQGGETGNLLPQTYGMTRGWMNQGLLDPYLSYYRAITVDALKAVEWVSRQPEADASRIATVGTSQGGGLSLIVSALSDVPHKTIADVPNMCHMDFGISQSTGSLTEAAGFVSDHPEHLDTVLHTLSYFDLLNLSDRLRAPLLVSVGLKDTICMPETIFAVYNRIDAPKELVVYPFNGHFTSENHFSKQIAFLRGD
ncbi:alpha/beta fold hydrolase [Cohnella sp. AR92]|uniref:acetylxylan esterase n=1 Tax=Cohnella sp. AR92 TaxID=648716 RepID=UPI000F8D78C9|nr:alpha/beta fold hydrolase [Cohnella sp. AR92]RUS47955.1 alpha/beta fold hydrolase [Cohnella sp. AR92]